MISCQAILNLVLHGASASSSSSSQLAHLYYPSCSQTHTAALCMSSPEVELDPPPRAFPLGRRLALARAESLLDRYIVQLARAAWEGQYEGYMPSTV